MTTTAPLATSTAAVLVVYDPMADAGPTIEQVRRLLAQVVVVDNSADGLPALARWRDTAGVTLIHHRNRGGLAGAYNAALRWLAAAAPQVMQVVFIDDDSDAAVLQPFLADATVLKQLADSNTAAVAPAHRDRATGLRARHLQLHRWRWHYLAREVRGLQRVAFVINSMSVWRVEALRRIGPFNEDLGVDHVDTEYCLRARRMRLDVYLHGDHEFAQSIGARRAYRLLGRELQSGGHSAARRFGIGRSTAWLGRKAIFSEPAFTALCFARLVYEVVGIVLTESDKWSKTLALARGAAHGLTSLRCR